MPSVKLEKNEMDEHKKSKANLSKTLKTKAAKQSKPKSSDNSGEDVKKKHRKPRIGFISHPRIGKVMKKKLQRGFQYPESTLVFLSGVLDFYNAATAEELRINIKNNHISEVNTKMIEKNIHFSQDKKTKN